MATKKQNMMIGYMISRLKLDQETKEDMIYNLTDARTTRIRDLNETEARHLIKTLTEQAPLPVTPEDKMRRKIISLAHEMRWEISNAERKKGKSQPVDMGRIDGWCIQYGYLKKPLDQHNLQELPRLVTQFEKVYKDYLKGF